MKRQIVDAANARKELRAAEEAERINLRNENSNLKAQLSQKDNVINTMTAQKNSEVNAVKNQVQNLQSQITSLNSSLNTSQSTIQSLKQQLIQETTNLSNDNSNLRQENINLLTELKKFESKSKVESVTKSTETEMENNEQDNIKSQLAQTEERLTFITKLFEEARKEKAEVREELKERNKELKSYKKSFLKKHDLSVNQSIEIEQLRKEVLEMSRSKVNITGSDVEEDLSTPFFAERSTHKSLTIPGTRTTISQFVDTQEVNEFIKAKAGFGKNILDSVLDSQLTTHDVKIAADSFSLVDDNNL